MYRHLSAFSAACLLITGPLLYAAGPKTPYEAVVTAENATLHAGPKKDKYYTTGMIPQGTVVVVHRHDPGGWFMIEPPPGSFSWIPAKFVERKGDVGTVTANNVRVQVGTPDSDRHDVSQRRLNEGDEVHILGQKVLEAASAGDAEVWYQITPPVYEWRWVMGRNVTPIDEVATPLPSTPTAEPQPPPGGHTAQSAGLRAPRPQPAADAELVDAEPREPVAGMHFNNTEDTTAEAAAPHEVTQAGGEAVEGESAAAPLEAPGILATLDEEFARLLETDAGQQELSTLEAGYRAARSRTDNPGTQRLIDRRLATIRSLSREAAAAKVFAEDTPSPDPAEIQEAQRIDQELAARQAEIEARLAGVQQVSAQRLVPQRVPQAASQQRPASIAAPQPQGAVSQPGATTADLEQVQFEQRPGTSPQIQQVHAQQVQPPAHARLLQPSPTRKLHPRFDGAGIVQTAPAGASAPYLLTARDGRVLAFLFPESGVNLQPYVGKPAGIHGARSFSTDLRADQIRVTGLEPVRLQ